LVTRLREEDLTRPLPNGWTVAITPAPMDADTINEAVRVLATALPPRQSAQLALEAAEAIDQALERLSAAMVTQIEAGGQASLLRRAVHRRDHLDRIEQALRA
jgi:hypothetical protein